MHPDSTPKPTEARLTALREHPRRAGRYVVELDGAVVGPVSVELIADLRLAVGMTVDAPLRGRLEEAVRAITCYDRALDALARRARSRQDLGRWLAQRAFTSAEIEPVLDRLEALGLLDDRAFALGFARSRLGAGRGYGPRRVAAELARKGVSRPLVDEVLAELRREREADGGEASGIDQAAQRKMRSLAGLEPEVGRRRLYGFLARRGFDANDILRVLRELFPT